MLQELTRGWCSKVYQKRSTKASLGFMLTMLTEYLNCDCCVATRLTPGCKRQTLISSTDRPRLLTLFT
jgi:hypothetical protein